MIRIQRLSAPEQLTEEVIADKTALFKADPQKNKVWKEPYIEDRLLEMSHGKCCYCECALDKESNYMEVEHFHDKHDYPDEVVKWENLLPSCKACNVRKGRHDTVADPIVNPSSDDPREHLFFRNCRYKGKDAKGTETINALNLNDSEKRCVLRYRVSNALLSKVEDLYEKAVNITLATGTRVKNKLINDVSELLEACQADRDYTAIKATVIGTCEEYAMLVSEMKAKGMWNQMHEDLDRTMRNYILL